MSRFSQSRVTAVLGPTNTGKTHLAIERMIGHDSGVIGFPLRLLARENYDRIAKAKGRSRVALVTGEEKIVPSNARYFCCTVEAMPLDRDFDFLAVDEIQLACDPERGHVFTDRLLHSRGREETLFLGADSMRPVIGKLVPEAEFIARPRFSQLTHAGRQGLGKLAPRTAVVAFSAAEVYATAEYVRRRRGGTAVVLGALSPRTRNAQVALFEAGEVDYLVATDAIGMGLNLRLDHVAFAALSKFDGDRLRRLTAPEVAQIAGRAGRHLNDGTFGTTLDAPALDPQTVESVESHRFEPQYQVYWRNRSLDFRAPALLLRSLEERPPRAELRRIKGTEDHQALVGLMAEAEIMALADNRDRVRLLWEVCQIPDFRKILSDHHLRLLGRLYRLLVAGDGRLPADWIAGQLAYIDQTEGDIDQLSTRLSQIRTWTTITHKADWLDDVADWQAKARAIEDSLSDALHNRLTQRFIDRRTTLLVRRLRDKGQLIASVRDSGALLVEGEEVGRLEGFRFQLDEAVAGEAARPLMSAARRALALAVPQRLKRLEEDGEEAFALDGRRLLWRGEAVARLKAGAWILTPEVEPLASEFLEGADRERLRRRLLAWLRQDLRQALAPLYRLEEAGLGGAARGLAFQLAEALGTLPRRRLQKQLAALTKRDRKALTALGVVVGAQTVRLATLANDERALARRALLWSLGHRKTQPPTLPGEVRCFTPREGQSEAFCLALGFAILRGAGGARVALRAELLDRFWQSVQGLAAQGPFKASSRLARMLGVEPAQLRVVLEGLGFAAAETADGLVFQRPARRKAGAAKRKGRPAAPRPSAGRPDSPFAGLDTALGLTGTSDSKPPRRRRRKQP